jgi:hypothetical protein
LVVIVQVIVGPEIGREQRLGEEIHGSLLSQELNKLGSGVLEVVYLLVERNAAILATTNNLMSDPNPCLRMYHTLER